MVAARDAGNAELRAMVHALSLQVAELQRQLDSGSDDSGMPPSKEQIEAKASRKAERAARQDERGWLVAAPVEGRSVGAVGAIKSTRPGVRCRQEQPNLPPRTRADRANRHAAW
jgi:hypothetical protein